jgi:hypothetical protein
VPDQATVGCGQADSEAMIRGGINVRLFVRGARHCLPQAPCR